MPSSGYTAISFVANEQPTTAKWNLIGSNDSSFNLGTGLEDNTIITRHIANVNITAAKLLNGKIYRRQGGSATHWGGSNVGTTNYDVSQTDPFIQVGDISVPGGQTNITFPVAYTYTPLILCTVASSSGNYPSWYTVLESNTGFSIQLSGGTGGALFAKWIAIGV